MSDQKEPISAKAGDPEISATEETKVPKVVVPASSNEDPAAFGRVDDEGNVWVKENGGERQVGSYPDGVPDKPLALYTRRFEDLAAKVNLFEMRLPTLAAREIEQTLKSLDEEIKEPAAVGNLDALRARVAKLHDAAKERKEEALADREAVVVEAESIAAQDPERTQWKNSGQRLRDLLDEWKALQRKGPRLDRADEDALWKRFSSARTRFDRHRRQFFSALDSRQAEVKRVKEALIEEATALQNSTDWGRTSAAYRDLMDRWKAAGRASRKEDDALWKRFREAQQVFFDARRANSEAVDSAYRENLKVKEALLEEAEALLPIDSLEATIKKLRDIQDRWEEAGHVPRADMNRVESRMRAVEKAVRDAEEEQWRRTDPETKARAEGMLGQLADSIAELEADLAKAEADGNEKKVASIRDALATKRAWQEQIQGSVD
ncbi:DUF349 domain-containing protein [Gleimia europaea]|uniref:DUF349 domain-containing protein n=1 Tax=Gleimia europaea ACS-120-V-Col10b TaxID=883069 RepID=A0A9W5RDG0_9ACTO|nr:DUF349 domain-containing protein [Gleimia europaea]EPD30434.1 hypothetical protein HMPREF9238_00177 [Gleimia europaea ACS-120-V-Col10b]